jgi:hypothetical protein
MTNTAELPDLDPYAHLSNQEIAAAVLAWPDGSEDQNRALVALRERAPQIGHNRPPLAEMIEAEVEPFRVRAAEVLELAGKALIIDADGAKSVLDLGVKCKDIEDEIDAARLARSKPYRDATALINGLFGPVQQRLAIARDGLRGMLKTWDDKQKAAAAAEQARLREEQRQREAAAAEAERRAREAAEAGRGQVNAELAAARAREEAEQAQRRADAVRPEPLRSHLGQVSRRREIKFEIADLGAVLAWLIQQPGHRSNVEQAVKTMIGSYLKSLGTDTVARGVDIPGIVARVEAGGVAVRR